MPNTLTQVLPLAIILFLALALTLLVWATPRSAQMVREALFRNAGVPYRNLMAILLGFVAATLLLSAGVLSSAGAAWIFASVLVLSMLLLVLVRPTEEGRIDRFAWGLIVIVNLGFGIGALVYGYREWFKWLWRQYRRINEPHELALEFLFLLGLILGVFVVRNWGKEQKAFTESLSGILGGTFVAAILGEALKEQGLTPMRALTYYGLGFSMSAAINLIFAAKLTSNYTNKRSVTSRSLLDFLYGSDRAKVIDGYFLKNFQEDPDYAKTMLTSSLVEWRKAAQIGFAERLEKRRVSRARELKNGDDEKLAKDRRRLRKLDPDCSKLKEALDNLLEFQEEAQRLKSLPEPRPRKKAARLRYVEERMREMDEEIRALRGECESEHFDEWTDLKKKLNLLKPAYFYELISIEGDHGDEVTEKAEPLDKEDLVLKIIYKQIGSADSPNVIPDMFRIGVSVRWQDTLEYVSAPGEYRQPFPYPGSVSGLALEFGQTIVMDRDRYKRFRNTKHMNGICPQDIEQDRGLDEIDYLSYIAIPLVSRPGAPGENPLGVVTVDNRLFVSRTKLQGEPLQGSDGIFSIRITRSQLTEYADNLYDQEDIDVKYLERVSKLVVPIVELYSKCRVGAI